MFCTKCGANNPEGYAFCTVCGAKIEGTQTKTVPQNQPEHQAQSPFEFVEKDEKIVADLSNGYLMNIIGGEALKKEKAFITNKRLYYKNTVSFTNSSDNIVDLEDITGTKITRFNPIASLIIGGLIFILFLVLSASTGIWSMMAAGIFIALICVVMFFISRKSFLTIEYAGGKIFFSVKGYSLESIRSFQKSIHYYKQLLKDSKK